MKYTTIVGLLLTVVGLGLYIIQEPDYTYKEFYTALLLGLGIGLFFGGIIGFAQKKRKKIVEPKFENKTRDTFINKDIIEDNNKVKF